MSNLAKNVFVITLVGIGLGACATNQGAVSGSSVTASIHGTKVALPIPDGYCALSEANPLDREMLAAMRRVNGGRNEVLAMFADCGQLKAFQSRGVAFSNSGTYLAPASVARKRLGIPRGRFSKLMADVFTQKKNQKKIRMARAEARDKLRSEGIGVASGSDVTVPKVLHRDDTGVFIGDTTTLVVHGKRARIAVVTGMTLVRQKAVSLNLSAPSKGRRTIKELLTAQRGNIRNLIAAN